MPLRPSILVVTVEDVLGRVDESRFATCLARLSLDLSEDKVRDLLADPRYANARAMYASGEIISDEFMDFLGQFTGLRSPEARELLADAYAQVFVSDPRAIDILKGVLLACPELRLVCVSNLDPYRVEYALQSTQLKAHTAFGSFHVRSRYPGRPFLARLFEEFTFHPDDYLFLEADEERLGTLRGLGLRTLAHRAFKDSPAQLLAGFKRTGLVSSGTYPAYFRP